MKRLLRESSQLELQPEGRADSYFTLNLDLAGVFLHDAVADRKPEPVPLRCPSCGVGLGGKERIVDAMEMLALDAIAGVLNGDKDVFPSVFCCDPQGGVRCAVHGIFGVQHEVQNDLLQLALVPVDQGKRGIEVRLDANLSRLELMFQQSHRVAQKLVQVRCR